MEDFDLDKLLDETEGTENSETPPLAPASEPDMLVPDSSESSQEPATKDEDAAEVDEASLKTSPQPPPERISQPETPASGQFDLGDDDSGGPTQDANSSVLREGDDLTPFQSSPSPEPSPEEEDPPAPLEEVKWPEIAPRQFGMAPIQRAAYERSRDPNDNSGRYDSQPLGEGTPGMKAEFNITVLGDEQLPQRLSEEIRPRLQQLAMQQAFYADDAVANEANLMSLSEEGGF